MKVERSDMMFTIVDNGVYYAGRPVKCCITNRNLKVSDLKVALGESSSSTEIRNALYKDDFNRTYCKEEGEKLKVCANCSRRTHPVFMEESQDGLVCRECRDTFYYYCEHCHTLSQRGRGWIVCIEDEDGEWIRDRMWLCDNCTAHGDFSDDTAGRYLMCENCGDLILREDAEEVNGRLLCPRCNREMNGDVVHSYHYRSDPGYGMPFLGIEERETSPLLGIELEIDRGGESNENATKIREKIGKQYVTATHDSSLHNGFELVSCPATMKHHLNTLKWEGGMQEALRLGYRSHDGGTCGLHVHIDRRFFSGDKEETEAKFFISFRNNLEWIKMFSRRYHYDYCAVNGFEHYNDGSSDTLGKIVYPPDKVWIRDKKQPRGERHMALNFFPEDTIEIRIFRGTLNYKAFVATLQFVNMWARFVKNNTIDGIINLRLQNFVNVATNNRYEEFLEYLKDRNIIEGKETGA